MHFIYRFCSRLLSRGACKTRPVGWRDAMIGGEVEGVLGRGEMRIKGGLMVEGGRGDIWGGWGDGRGGRLESTGQ